jgi:hypothetical protein
MIKLQMQGGKSTLKVDVASSSSIGKASLPSVKIYENVLEVSSNHFLN